MSLSATVCCRVQACVLYPQNKMKTSLLWKQWHAFCCILWHTVAAGDGDLGNGADLHASCSGSAHLHFGHQTVSLWTQQDILVYPKVSTEISNQDLKETPVCKKNPSNVFPQIKPWPRDVKKKKVHRPYMWQISMFYQAFHSWDTRQGHK